MICRLDSASTQRLARPTHPAHPQAFGHDQQVIGLGQVHLADDVPMESKVGDVPSRHGEPRVACLAARSSLKLLEAAWPSLLDSSCDVCCRLSAIPLTSSRRVYVEHPPEHQED